MSEFSRTTDEHGNTGTADSGTPGPYDASGVDLSLLRYVLSLSPIERLRLMERQAEETRKLNEYGRRSGKTAPREDR